MAATIRLTCKYHPGVPSALRWAANTNKLFHPPHAQIEGQEVQLKWDEPIDIQVPPGRSLKLEVYFRVFDVLRFCGAEVEIDALRDGETRSYE